MKSRFFLQAVSVAITPVLFDSAAHACAVCIFGAAGDPLTDAFNWSILFLMAMPYTILVSIVGFLFYSHRRAVKKARSEGEKAPILRLAWIHKESGR